MAKMMVLVQCAWSVVVSPTTLFPILKFLRFALGLLIMLGFFVCLFVFGNRGAVAKHTN